MKKITFEILFLFFAFCSMAQNVAINATGNAPDGSAMLDVQSTNKGLLIPKMGQAQRIAISNPATGLLLYQTDGTAGFYYNSGTPASPVWTALSSAFSGGWSLTGNSGTNSSINFLGTTDNKPLNFRINNLYAGQLHAGTGNVFVGLKAGQNNTTGFSNIAIGNGALFSNTDRSNLVAIGDSALYNNGTGASQADDANFNTALGSKALFSNTTGFYNTATGFNSLSNSTTGNWNAAFGSYSLYNNTTGTDNTALGNGTLRNNSIGINNTAVGSGSLYYNVTGNQNTAVGAGALVLNNANRNTALGASTLTNNTSGFSNTSLGFATLSENTTGNYNTAGGYEALEFNTTGSENTALGLWALLANTVGNFNTAVGGYAMYGNSTGYSNSAFGYDALKSNSSGFQNTAIGDSALYKNSTGVWNTAVGRSALADNTGGFYNLALGAFSGTDPATPNLHNTVSIGNNGWLNAASNQVFIGNNSSTYIGGYVGWSIYSDGRIKNQVKEDVKGLDFIVRLRPVTYHRNIDIATQISGNKPIKDFPEKYDAEKIKYSGFIAQEVEKAATEAGYDFSGIKKPRNDKDLYTLDYASFVVPLVKAVQEQQDMIDKQNKIIDDLIKRITVLEAKK